MCVQFMNRVKNSRIYALFGINGKGTGQAIMYHNWIVSSCTFDRGICLRTQHCETNQVSKSSSYPDLSTDRYTPVPTALPAPLSPVKAAGLLRQQCYMLIIIEQ